MVSVMTRTTLIFIAIVALIALGLFGVLYLLDRNTDLDRNIEGVEIEEEEEVVSEPTLRVSSNEVFQGGALGFSVLGIENEPEVFWGEQKIPVMKIRNGYVGAIGISVSERARSETLTAVLSSGATLSENVSVSIKNYGVSKLTLPQKATDAGQTTGSLVSTITVDDNKKIADATSIITSDVYFEDKFVIPTREWVDVGGFGIVRQSGESSIRHLGTDLEAEVGDPIYSINNGKIVMAEYLNNYGNTIIIDHGTGIWSLYLHLSKIDVKKFQTVDRGQKIGEAGSTGLYSFEPHLHFSIRIRGKSIDPKSFLDSINLHL